MTLLINHAYTVRPRRREPGAGMANLLAAVSERLHQTWTAYKTREELSRLTDRELADIGIHREDIPMVAQQQERGDGIVRHSDLGMLLAMNDNELSAMGLKRSELEDFRTGRVKFVRRHTMIESGRR